MRNTVNCQANFRYPLFKDTARTLLRIKQNDKFNSSWRIADHETERIRYRQRIERGKAISEQGLDPFSTFWVSMGKSFPDFLRMKSISSLLTAVAVILFPSSFLPVKILSFSSKIPLSQPQPPSKLNLLFGGSVRHIRPTHAEMRGTTNYDNA